MSVYHVYRSIKISMITYVDIIFIIVSGRNDVNSESLRRASEFFILFSYGTRPLYELQTIVMQVLVFSARKLTYLGRRTHPETSVELTEARVSLKSLRHVQNFYYNS